ncbi:MAG: hypothetical protein ACC645_15280 [Pirellulales bacterium]
MPLQSASIGPWLTVAFVDRASSVEDGISRSDQALAAEEASHRILDRVMRSRQLAIKERREPLSPVHSAARDEREGPTMKQLDAVWTDALDWLGRRPS